MPDAGTISLECRGGLATLWIDSPERRNALSQPMWLTLEQRLATLATDDAVRVLLLRGRGGKAFSAGADIVELAEMIADPQRLEHNNSIIRRVQLALEAFPKPTVALIDGACVGGGFGLALACDLRFASHRAVFAVTPAKLGLLYSLPDTRRMLRTLGSTLTRDLLFSGRRMEAAEAWERGLLTALLEPAQLEPLVLERCQAMVDASASALSGIKRTLNHLEGVGENSAESINRLFADAFSSPDAREGAAAFLDKRPPRFNRRETSK